jgi:hypothetical protein
MQLRPAGRKHAIWWSQVCELLVASVRPDPPKDAMLDGHLISVSPKARVSDEGFFALPRALIENLG